MSGFEVSASVASITTSFQKSSIALRVLQEKRSEVPKWKRAKTNVEQVALEVELESALHQGSDRVRYDYDFYFDMLGHQFAAGDVPAQLKLNEIKEEARCMYRLFEFAKFLDADDTRKLKDMATRCQHQSRATMAELQTRILANLKSEEASESQSIDKTPPLPRKSSKRERKKRLGDRLGVHSAPVNRRVEIGHQMPPSYNDIIQEPPQQSVDCPSPVRTESGSYEAPKMSDVHPVCRLPSTTTFAALISESDLETDLSDPYFSSTSVTVDTAASSVNADSPPSHQVSKPFIEKTYSQSSRTVSEHPLFVQSPQAMSSDQMRVPHQNNESTSSLNVSRDPSGTVFVKPRSNSATSDSSVEPRSSSETSSQGFHSSIDISLYPPRASMYGPPKSMKVFKPTKSTRSAESNNDFCPGAYRIQEDPLRKLVAARRPVGTYGFSNYYTCPRRSCTFEGLMFGSGNNRHPDRSIHTSKSGILYRWVFLAKSHAPLPLEKRKGKDRNKVGYKCLICHLEGTISADIFDGIEEYMQHIRDDHTQVMSDHVQTKINCVFARQARRGEAFDICIPPPQNSIRQPEHDPSTYRILQVTEVPDVHRPGYNQQPTGNETLEPAGTSLERPAEEHPELVDLSKTPEIGLLRELLKSCRSPTKMSQQEVQAAEQFYDGVNKSNQEGNRAMKSLPRKPLPQIPSSESSSQERDKPQQRNQSHIQERYTEQGQNVRQANCQALLSTAAIFSPAQQGTIQDRYVEQAPKPQPPNYRIANPDPKEDVAANVQHQVPYWERVAISGRLNALPGGHLLSVSTV